MQTLLAVFWKYGLAFLSPGFSSTASNPALASEIDIMSSCHAVVLQSDLAMPAPRVVPASPPTAPLNRHCDEIAWRATGNTNNSTAFTDRQ
jgi:hypothetical protein